MSLRERLTRRYRGFTAWIKLITFYKIAVGMKSTMSHLIHYKPSPFSTHMKSGSCRTIIGAC